jgi:hypothetical protein
MAARRLIIVLVVLLAISVLAAALAPERRSGRFPGGESTSTTTAEEEPAKPTGDLVEAELAASAEKPQTVRATVGERLSLSVSSRRPIEVGIEALGLIGNAAPTAPAVFDVLLREPGRLPVTDTTTGRIVGRLIVEPRDRRSPTPRPGHGGAGSHPDGAQLT